MRENWIGIRASAVVATLGSVGTLAMSALMVLAMLAAPPPNQNLSPAFMKAALIGTSLGFAGLSVWGIWTAIGIFRRRPWARISILVFAAMGAIMFGSGLLVMAFIDLPTPVGGDPRITHYARIGILSIYGVLLAVMVWWLVLFNRPRSRAYFAQTPTLAAAPARPLSISIIAWYLLFGGVMAAVCAVLRMPTMLFGIVATGWGAAAICTAYTAVAIYLGTGLLQLDDHARLGAIAFFGLVIANSLWMAVSPGAWQRALDAMPRWLQIHQPLPDTAFRVMIMAGGAFALLPVWFLVRRRAAFIEHR